MMTYTRFCYWLLLAIHLLMSLPGYTQDDRLDSLSMPSIRSLQSAARELDQVKDQLRHSSTVFLRALKKTEQKWKLSNDTNVSLDKLSRIRVPNTYQPRLDSLATLLHFTHARFGETLAVKQKQARQQVQTQLDGLTKEMERAQQLRQLIATKLQQEYNRPQIRSVQRQLRRYQQLAAGYEARYREAEDLIRHSDKMGKRLLAEIRQQPAFQQFFARYSELARLFPPAAGPSAQGQSIPGLQSHEQLLQHIQQATGGKAIDPIQLLQQGAQRGGATINPVAKAAQTLRQKTQQQGAGPGTEPNLKGLPFPKRLFLQANLQSSSGNRVLPAHSQLAMGAGYKINKGLQLSAELVWRMGWGKPIKTIRLTHEGYGFRTNLEYKLKGQWWLAGVYERHYFPAYIAMAANAAESGWRNAALMGVSKTISLKAKGAKKVKLQLLYDFLAPTQQPATSPWTYRMGYIF